MRKDGRSAGLDEKSDQSGPGWSPRLTVAAVAAVLSGVVGEWAYRRTGASALDLIRDVTVGWTFALAGLVAWWRRPENRTGRLMVAEGLSWFIGNLQGTSVPALAAVGVWFEGLNMAVLAHLVLAYPDGRLTSRPARVVTLAGYATVLVGGLARAGGYDPTTVDHPSAYLSCRQCAPNPLAVYADTPYAVAGDLLYHGFGALLTVATMVLVVRRLRRASPPLRRALLPVTVGLAVATVFLAWNALELDSGLFWPLVVASDLSQVAVPIAFLVGLLRMRLRRAAVSGLVVELGASPTPRQLQESLARVLGDSTLQVGLWSPGQDHHLSPDGEWLSPVPAAGRSVLRVESDGEPSAILIHDVALNDDPELLTAVAAAVRLGLENSWLRSELTSRSAEAEHLGARVLDAVDRERRRLERDLHDGAQQRLVTAMMALGRIRKRLPEDADASLRHTVVEADESLRLALAELRDLARGIHPQALTRSGLRPAIASLAERSSLPVMVSVDYDRYPPLVESTAYFTVCEALANAVKHSAATAVSAAVRRRGEWLVVEVADDGVGGADSARGSGLTGLADRLAAVGGVLQVRSPPGGGTRIRAELPCG